MQRVVEFRKMKFWSSQVDLVALNEKITQYINDGWHIQQLVPNAGLGGRIFSYTILLERPE